MRKRLRTMKINAVKTNAGSGAISQNENSRLASEKVGDYEHAAKA